MTRFDADEPADRRALFADAIAAHRERESAFLTIEADEAALPDPDDPDEPLVVPWVQFSDGVVNLDCTDEEYDRLTDLLDEFPAFTVDELTQPEEAEGTNARISALADRNRVAQFLDELFVRVYELPDGYQAWVAEV